MGPAEVKNRGQGSLENLDLLFKKIKLKFQNWRGKKRKPQKLKISANVLQSTLDTTEEKNDELKLPENAYLNNVDKKT